MWKLFDKTNTIKSDLLSFRNEPLSGLSVFLLIVLDIFIFSNVMMGIEGETIKSPKPYAYYPSSCSKHFDEPKRYYNDFTNLEYSYKRRFEKQVSPYCSEVKQKIHAFSERAQFKERLAAIREIDKKIAGNNSRLETIRKQYNTRLFEQIAKMPNNRALRGAKNEYEALIEDNRKLKAKKSAIPPVTTMDGYDAYRDYVLKNKEAFKAEKASYEFWQPFYEFGHLLAFVVPLLLIFGYLYYRSKRKELRGEHYNPVVKIISAHISVILSLPVIWETLCIVYHVVPKTLLKQIVDYLISIGLLSILNYLAIGVVVVIFGALIYFIQKRTISHKKIGSEKNIQRIISFSQCPACSYRVDYSKPFCPHCSQKLQNACPACGKMTITGLPYCQECGATTGTLSD